MSQQNLLLPDDETISDQRISKDRRRFLLFTGFDLGLTSILWIIFTVSKGSDWRLDFLGQCNFADPHFFSTSFFDVVLVSFCRFVWLVIWYGIVNVKHWAPVAFATAATTGFLVTKIIYFFLEASNVQTNNPLSYAIPICSFVLAWIELYLLDIQVLPREQKAQEEAAAENIEGALPSARRRPLGGAGYMSDYRTAGERSTEEESDEGDEAGDERRRRRRTRSGGNEKDYRAYANFEYIRIGKQAMETGRSLYGQVDSWSKKSSTPLVRATTTSELGRIFYLKVEFAVSVETLFRVLYTESENVSKWNKTVLETKTVLRINENTDVTYSVSAPALRGAVASRDFLDVRYLEQHGRTYHVASISVRSDLRLPSKNTKIIRGENGPNYCVFRPSQISENHSTLEWIMNTNLNGNLPRKIVENSLTSFLLDFVKNLEHYLKSFE